MKSYKDTLNLPRTDFPMKANLANREPDMLKHWQDIDLYSNVRAAFKGRPKYILHDCPPYADGDIHIGHVVNKVLIVHHLDFQEAREFFDDYYPWKLELDSDASGRN